MRQIGWVVLGLVMSLQGASWLDAPGLSQSEGVAAARIRDAAFLDSTPRHGDLYIIQTRDKGQRILIYCSHASCYRLRNVLRVV